MKLYSQDDVTRKGGKTLEKITEEDAGAKKEKNIKLDKEEREDWWKWNKNMGMTDCRETGKDWNVICKHAESVGTGRTKQIQI